MKTVIMTAVGSAAAPPATQSFRQAGLRVVGCDIYPRSWNPGSMDVDVFFQAQLAAQGESYVAQLLKAAEDHGAAWLIPLTDPEVDALSPHKAAFAKLGCCLCTPDEAVARLCRDKSRMNAFLADEGICNTIPTYDPYSHPPAEDDFPLMLKPQNGRSSQGQTIADTPEKYRAALSARTDLIAQPYLTGPIFTVDVARDSQGHVHTAVRQELLRNPSGLGMTVQTYAEHPLQAVCRRIADKVGLVGVVNMEFIRHDDRYWFLEVNPRFSGGVGFSVLAGVDFPLLMLKCHSGEDIGEPATVRALTIARRYDMTITE